MEVCRPKATCGPSLIPVNIGVGPRPTQTHIRHVGARRANQNDNVQIIIF